MGYIEILIRNIEDYVLIIDDYIKNYYKIEIKDKVMEEMCYEDIYIYNRRKSVRYNTRIKKSIKNKIKI